MKKTTLLLSLLSLTSTIFAQPFGNATADYQIVKQDYENTSGEKSSTTFKYDKSGNLIKALWSLNDKSRYSVNYYEHDLNGKLVSAFREFSDSLTSFELFIYDSEGNKQEEQFYRSDGVKGYATYKYKDNQLIEAELKNFKGWLTGTILYKYNENEVREKALLMIKNKSACKIDYEYDGDGNLVKEFWDFDGKWSQTFNYIYEKYIYNKIYYSSPFLSGNGAFRISTEDYTFNNEKGGPSNYFYNEEGLLTKKVFQRSDGVVTNTTYEYDKEGKLVSSERNYSNSDIAKFTYTYDENNNLVNRSCFMADTLNGFESYLYNADGELTKAYLKNFDSWLTGTVTFNTNKLGAITSGNFKGQNGFDANILFTYNEMGQLSEIKWDFSMGKFQQYFFIYEPVKTTKAQDE